MRKKVSVCIIVIGVILFAVGLFLKTPSRELTTYSVLKDKYSVIEEYVGGDAYNYIIGASLVGGEIAGVKAQKAVFISIGLLITCLGLYTFSQLKENSVDGQVSAVSKDENVLNINDNTDNSYQSEEIVQSENASEKVASES